MSKYISGGFEGFLTNETPYQFIEQPKREVLYLTSDFLTSINRNHHFKVSSEGVSGHLEAALENGNLSDLVTATTQLVNKVLEESLTGDPITSLVFLDKSARNGAFLFYTMWDGLQQRGEIPQGVARPDIRYMNVGRFHDEKHSSQGPVALFKDQFTLIPEGMSPHVLVVDEYIESGGTARRAQKLLMDAFGIKADAISMFSTVPIWYGTSDIGLLGVKDPKHEDFWSTTELGKSLSGLPAKTLLSAKHILDRFDGTGFEEIFGTVYIKDKVERSSVDDIRKALEDKGLDVAVEDILELLSIAHTEGMGIVNIYELVQYLESAGGYFAVPTSSEYDRQNFIAYRTILKSIIQSYLIFRDIDRADPERTTVLSDSYSKSRQGSVYQSTRDREDDTRPSGYISQDNSNALEYHKSKMHP